MDHNSYVLDLTGNRFLSSVAISHMTSQTWLDDLTIAAAFEFVIYSVDVNLACMVRVFWEFPASGGAISVVEIYSMRFYRAVNNSLHYFVMFWEIVFVLFTVYMIVTEVLSMKAQGLVYFISLSTYTDVIACLLSIVVVILYIIFNKEIFTLVRMFQHNKELMGHFRFVASIDNTLTLVYGFLLALITFKFLHLLRFNPIIWRFMQVLKLAAPKLLYVAFIIMFNLFLFGWIMVLLAGYKIDLFSTMGECITTLFRSMMGDLYVDEMKEVHHFWGPVLYLFFLMAIMILVINLLIAVICEALGYASRRPLPNTEAELLWLLIHKVVQYFGLKIRTS